MTTVSCLADTPDPAPHGYTNHASGRLARLNKVEGQVRGVTRMVADERYCIDVLTQISTVTRALLRRPKGGLVEGSTSGGDGDTEGPQGRHPGHAALHNHEPRDGQAHRAVAGACRADPKPVPAQPPPGVALQFRRGRATWTPSSGGSVPLTRNSRQA